MEKNFINWTAALTDQFFSRDSQEEVFLYVDEQILDKIGNENGLGDHNSFLNTVLVDNADRIDLYDKLYLQTNGYKPIRTPAENRKLTSSNILKFASFIGDKIKGAPFYFPYVILVMYYASQTAKSNDQAIGRNIKNQLGINDYESIIYLFNRLNNDYPRFRNKSRTRQRIIGLIKYQLLLSPSEIREINEALYKTLYKDDFTLTYLDKIRRIRNYVNDDVKSILSMSLLNPDYQYRINCLFEDFDLESYKNEIHSRSINNNNTEFAALYLDFSNGRGFRLLSTYRPEEEKTLVQDRNSFTFSPSIDSIDIYNNVFVRYNNDEFVDLGDYSMRSNDLVIKPIALGNAAFFFKYGNGTYLQSIYHYNRKVYVFIKKDRQNKYINQWEEWADQHARNCKRIDENYDVSDLTKNNWALYTADGLDAQYGDIAGDGWDLENRVKSIVKRGGIRCPGEKNVYLINALPYFEFPEIINEQGLDLIIKEDDMSLESTDYRYFIHENRLIVDLLKDLNYEESRKISIIIKYLDPEADECLSTADYPNGQIDFFVRGQRICYDQDALYCFDRWGEKTDNSNCKIKGNLVAGVKNYPLGQAAHVIERTYGLSDLSMDYFYFINLLASCVYMEPSGQITRDRLEQCINSAAMRLNLWTNDDGFVPKTISMLINCGYLAADYGTRHYQTIPPAFMKIPRSFNVGGNQIWMLAGAYTRRFLTDLFSFCKNYKIKLRLRYSEKLDQSRNSLKLLPPIILLDGLFDPESFKATCPHHNFDIRKNSDQSLDILSLIHSISEYRGTLVKVSREPIDFSRYKANSDEFPKIWEDNPYTYNNHIYIEESNGGTVYKPSISHGWNHLFCFYKRNNPFIIKDAQHIYINTDLHLPSLIQRSLFIMNVGIPSYKKVFICGSTSRQLYTVMKAYNVNNERRMTLFRTLTGVDNVDENQFIRDKVISSINGRNENWAYHMELWIKRDEEELNNIIPNKLLVLRYEDKKYHVIQDIAVSTLSQNRREFTQKNYVLIGDSFLEVNSNCNETMSFIIKNPHWTTDQISLIENPDDFALPDRDKYNIEEITIL